jgi:hypothetical protein
MKAPSSKAQKAVHEAAQRVRSWLAEEPPQVPRPPKRPLPLLEPSPRARQGIELAARRSMQRLPELMTSHPRHPTWGPPHAHAAKVPKPKTQNLQTTIRKPGPAPEWAWVAVPEEHSPVVSHHSLHTLGFGAMRHLVIYGGMDPSGRPSASVWTLPVSAIANVLPSPKQLLPDPRHPNAAAARASSQPIEGLLELSQASAPAEEQTSILPSGALSWIEERDVSGFIGIGDRVPRYAHASCVWNCHRMLIHGGMGGSPGHAPKLLSDTHVLLCVRRGGSVGACKWQWAEIEIVGEVQPEPRRFHALAALDARMAFMYGGEVQAEAPPPDSEVESNDGSDDWSQDDQASQGESRCSRPTVVISSQMFALVDLRAEMRHYQPVESRQDPSTSGVRSKQRPRLTWSELSTVGNRPPALCHHSLLAAGEHMLVLTGGRGDQESLVKRYSFATYLFHVETFSWTMLRGSGQALNPWLPKIALSSSAADPIYSFGVGAAPREQVSATALPLTAQSSHCVVIFGGV